MEWKEFEIKRKLVSAKNKVYKVFRLIGSLGKEDSDVSSSNPVFIGASYEPVNSLINYGELELKKAEGLEYWRRWFDRPK